jgi:hypothetical protein
LIFLVQRELDSPTRDVAVPDKARHAIHAGVGLLRTSPFACRKADDSPFTRELIFAFGSTGYVALFEIVNDSTVIVGAIRRQWEDGHQLHIGVREEVQFHLRTDK